MRNNIAMGLLLFILAMGIMDANTSKEASTTDKKDVIVEEIKPTITEEEPSLFEDFMAFMKEECSKETTETESVTVKKEDEVLTVDNCPDLAKIITDTSMDAQKAFVEAYKFKEIELDANVYFYDKLPNKNTRYLICFTAGDFVQDSVEGTTFIDTDFGINDKGIDNTLVNTGKNVKFRAKIFSYDENRQAIRVILKELKQR